MLPLTPTKLGRYEIVDEIGKGAMGVVFLARDPLIGRLVALKTFRIGYSVKDQELEQFRIRFMREAQSAGILTHPNIVTIHDVVEQSEEGLAFIAMEYVRGTNLKLVLQGDQPVSPQFVLDVISQVGDALDYAHSNKVIHRDVKPANILITADNRVKITDFGIARLETSNLTMEGQLLGTPNYMAPEQIQGKEVDHRSDLFSLGVVLYEMLTRHKPFQGENLTVVSHRIVYDHFTPPREYVNELAPGIEPVLNRALEKDPARRYQRARELVEDLRRVLVPGAAAAATAAVSPPPPPPPPSGQDLNDTMSLNQTMVLPPQPAGGGPARAAASGGRARSVLVAVLTFTAVIVLATTGVLLSRSWSRPDLPPPLPVDAAVEQSGVRFASLLEQAQRLRPVNPGGAAQLFRQAEQLAPPERKAEISGLVQQADLEARTAQQATRQQQLEKFLNAAEAALSERRYDEAVTLASGVLAQDPTNVRAPVILKKAREAAALARKRPRTTPVIPQETSPRAEETVAATTPEPVSSAPAEAVREATLHIDLHSDFPAGTLIIYLDDVPRLREPFGSRGGIFRRDRGEPVVIQKPINITPGTYRVRVHVAPHNVKAAVKTFASANFLNGGNRTLQVRIDDRGAAVINLD